MTVQRSTVEAWAWVLIYGGLLVVSLGWFTPADSVLSIALLATGATAAVGGAVLIWLRSRMG